MTQLAPAFDTANPQDATPATELVASEEQEVVTSEEEGEVTEETPGKTKPEFKPGPPKTIPIERFNEVYGQMRRLDRLAMQLLEERKQQPTVKKESEVEVDWDSLTPKQFAAEMRKANRKDLTEMMSQALTPLTEQAKVKAAQDSIAQAAKDHKDYFNYRESMIEIAEKHPTLDAEEVYLIASGRSPEAGDRIMTRVKEKVEQKRNALTTRRSSPASRTTTNQSFKTVREGALAAAKELGYDVE